MRYYFIPVVAIAFLFTVSCGAARAAVSVPSTAEPSRAEQQIAPVPPPPPAAGAASVSARPLKAPPGAENIKFTLVSIDFDGLTVYQKTDILPLYQGKIGQTVTLADIYVIANQLTAKYRNDGYILSQAVIPPQRISGGHVHIQIIEGFVNDVKLEGDTNGRLRPLYPYLDKVRAMRPFNFKALEHYLLLMNDLPGITAKAVLVPAKFVPGATDIIIETSRKPVDLSFQVDNRGSRYMGPLQATASARLNNMIGDYEAINIQRSEAPLHNEMDYTDINVMQPLDYDGTQLTIGGSETRTRPGFTLTDFDVYGLAKRIDLEIMHPFIRARSKNLFTTLRFNYLDSLRRDNTGGPDIIDHLSVVRLGSQFLNSDSFGGANTAMAELSKGLDFFNSTSADDPNTTRPGADNLFWKGTAEISRVQRLTESFDLFISGTGQYSPERLLTSEQFGVGGANYGSAYDTSEITGDKGMAARGELRLNNPVQTPLDLMQPYAFYDAGKVWDPGSTAAASRIASLSSAGLGLRFVVNKNFSGSIEGAVPLTRDVGTAGNRHPRVFGALSARF